MRTPHDTTRQLKHTNEYRQEVAVYTITSNGKFTATGEKKEVYGIATLVPELFFIQDKLDLSDKDQVAVDLARVESIVKMRLPSHSMLPSHPGWQELSFKSGQLESTVYVLFGKVDMGQANLANSRLTRLIYHIGAQSEYLGRTKVHVIRDDKYNKYDGWCALNPAIVTAKTSAIKVYGIDMKVSYITNATPTVKCGGEISWKTWKAVCKVAKVDYTDINIGVIIPEKSLKFEDKDNPVDEFEISLFEVFPNNISKRAKISLQALTNIPLTEEASSWVVDEYVKLINNIKDAYADKTGKAVANLISKSIGDADTDENAAFIQDSVKSVLVRLQTGLPMTTDEYLNSTLPLVLKTLKHIEVPGVFEMISPSSIGYTDIVVSERFVDIMKKKYNIKITVGSEVIMLRPPSTGIEAITLNVVAIGPCMKVNPTMMKEIQSGDFDGDGAMITVLPFKQFKASDNNSAITTKVKTEIPMTVAEANAAGFWSQFSIPEVDGLLRAANEQGLNPTGLRSALQWTVDSAKNQIDFDLDDIVKCTGLEFNDVSALTKLFKARLTNDKSAMVKYNILVATMRKYTTKIPWMNVIAKHHPLPFIVSGYNNEYYEAISNKDSKYHKRITKIMTKVYHHVIGYNFESKLIKKDNTNIDMSLLDKNKVMYIRQSVLKYDHSVKQEAYDVYNAYMDHFTRVIGKDVTAAFDNLRAIKEYVSNHPKGDLILKYIYACIMLKADKRIPLKSNKLLSYLPVRLGSYDLCKLNAWVGINWQYKVTIK